MAERCVLPCFERGTGDVRGETELSDQQWVRTLRARHCGFRQGFLLSIEYLLHPANYENPRTRVDVTSKLRYQPWSIRKLAAAAIWPLARCFPRLPVGSWKTRRETATPLWCGLPLSLAYHGAFVNASSWVKVRTLPVCCCLRADHASAAASPGGCAPADGGTGSGKKASAAAILPLRHWREARHLPNVALANSPTSVNMLSSTVQAQAHSQDGIRIVSASVSVHGKVLTNNRCLPLMVAKARARDIVPLKAWCGFEISSYRLRVLSGEERCG
jgi:hypothetical protein